MAFSKRIDYWQKETERWREVAFLPFLKLCPRLNITANQVTTLRLFLAATFPFLAVSKPVLAWWLMAASIFLDAVDGPVARFLKTASDRGKFIDVLADQMTFALLGLGLTRMVPALTLELTILSLGIPFLYLIVSVSENENKPSDWLIHSKARLIGYKILFLAVMVAFLTAAWEMGTVRLLLRLEIIMVAGHFLWHYLRFAAKSNVWQK